MNDSESNQDENISGFTEEELAAALEDYDEALARGSESSAAIKKRHPELAELFDCLDRLDQMALPGTQRNSTVDEPTYVPSETVREGFQQENEEQREFGDFEILEELGRGGMGVVYKARQISLDRIVALKMILASRFAGHEELRRFQQEAKAAARLRHEHIVRVFEVGEHAGQHYFTMDFIEGESLGEILARGPQTPEETAKIISSIADAVQYLHDHGIVHRDLKPSNIIIDPEGNAHVTDFGLAKLTDNMQTQTDTGAIVGTPSYMSPEQAAGKTSEIGPSSDIYGLGSLLYAMLTGQPPFREANPFDTLVQVVESEPPLPSTLCAGIPRSLERICLHCLEKAPEDRYRTATDLKADLERFLCGEEPEIDAASFVTQFKKWARREPGLAGRLAAILAAVLVVEVRFFFLGGDAWFHTTVLAIFSCWAATSVVCQRVLSGRQAWSLYVPYVWVLADVMLLTWVLSISEPPLGPLLIGYPTLVVAAGMWFRTNLVWFMTSGSLVSYAFLIMLRPELSEPVHYPILFAAVLCVIGYMVAYQIQRVRALSRYYEHRQL